MIKKIRGILVEKDENKVCVDVGGICYEINIPKAVYYRLTHDLGKEVELVIYNYLHIEKNKSIPVMIGFNEELEREFFEKFISVSGIGPRAALKAFDRPISLIARAIEEGDVRFLNTLEGIGKQKAKQIVAHLQGKVGRFALIKEKEHITVEKGNKIKEMIGEAKQILRRLQYSAKEIDSMVKKALQRKPQPESVEELLNQIYYQER